MTDRPQKHKQLSVLLEEYARQTTREEVTIHDIADLLGSRSIGGLLLIFALPVALPIPMPGISAAFGLFLVFFSIQLALGLKHVWIPSFLAQQHLSRDRFEHIVQAIIPVLRRMEKLVFPRAAFLVQDWVKIFVGLFCIVLSLVVMLPIPFGNVVPSFAIALFSLALIQQDGAVVAMGILVACVALALTVVATVELGSLL